MVGVLAFVKKLVEKKKEIKKVIFFDLLIYLIYTAQSDATKSVEFSFEKAGKKKKKKQKTTFLNYLRKSERIFSVKGKSLFEEYLYIKLIMKEYESK